MVFWLDGACLSGHLHLGPDDQDFCRPATSRHLRRSMPKVSNMLERLFPTPLPTPRVSEGGLLVKIVRAGFIPGVVQEEINAKDRSLIRRAMDQPENIRKVISLARSGGLAKALAQVRGKPCGSVPIGYSGAGLVLAVGEDVNDLRPGDRVAVVGQDQADYAEFLDVPRNMAVPIPHGLDFSGAATIGIGGLALHALRRAAANLGEFCLIFGGGLIGQMAVRLAVAGGARVLVVEYDQDMLDLALAGGAEAAFNPDTIDVVRAVMHHTGGRGSDASIFCLNMDKPKDLSDALSMTRPAGRVVLLGVPDRELFRDSLARKELDILIANTSGPGSGEEAYQQKGVEYPYNQVRWTQNRNFAEYLRLLASGRISAEGLVQGAYAVTAPESLLSDLESGNSKLLFLLDYGQDLPDDLRSLTESRSRIEITPATTKKSSADQIRVGVIGASGFTVATYLPDLVKIKDLHLVGICNQNAAKAAEVARQFGAAFATADYKEILTDPSIDLVMISSRHYRHGPFALEALKQGKHVFVEKPLCTLPSELAALQAFYEAPEPTVKPLLMVGLNRRFSKYIKEVKRAVDSRVNPLVMHYRMNAGHIPPEHWLHGPEGGGRIVGEACQILDIFSYLVGAPAVSLARASLRPMTGNFLSADNRSAVIEYEDGSIGSIDYFAMGSKDLPRELLEVHFDGCSILMDDFKSLKSYGVSLESLHGQQPDKGWKEELEALAAYLKGPQSDWPIPLWSMLESSRLSFLMA